MTRSNNLYMIIGALMAVVVAAGFYIYREETKPKGVELSIGESGIQLKEK